MPAAVDLDHDRDSLRGDERLGVCEGGDSPVGGSRHAAAGAEILHEALRPLDSRGSRARPEGGDAIRLQPVDEPSDKRCLGSDNDEVDGFLAAE